MFTTFDPPGAPIIAPTSINNRGQIAGSTTSDPVLPEAEEVHGFLLDRGRFTRIDFPGAPRTLAWGLNDRAQIVGIYQNPAATGQPSPMRMPMRMSGR